MTTFLVETISFIIVFQSASVTEVVFNFIALAVIDEFDIFVYESLRSSLFKCLLEEDNQKQLLQISLTTSRRALSGEMGENSDVRNELNGKFLCNKIQFWQDRSLINRIYWLIYKLMRFFYIVFYFYFYPLSIFYVNFLATFYFTGNQPA